MTATALHATKDPKPCSMWAYAPMVKNIVVIALLFVLDVRDLIYKLYWIGPFESFSFRTATQGMLIASELVPLDANMTQIPNYQFPDDSMSSWPSFLSSCAQLQRFGAGPGHAFFVNALGINCTLGDSRPVNQLVLTADLRVDSVVWAACQLLTNAQKPSICQESMVLDFLERYSFADVVLPLSWIAPPGSGAEKELLEFLQLISSSYPIHKTVCVEAFEWPSDRPLGQYHSNLYGCASPNLYQSRFIGLKNPNIRELLKTKAWLTADVIEMLGLHFKIRQNNENMVFRITRDDTSGQYVLSASVRANFSCTGQLYVLLVVLDLTLVVIYMRASFEIVVSVLLPQSQELQRRRVKPTPATRLSQSQSNGLSILSAVPLAIPLPSHRFATSPVLSRPSPELTATISTHAHTICVPQRPSNLLTAVLPSTQPPSPLPEPTTEALPKRRASLTTTFFSARSPSSSVLGSQFEHLEDDDLSAFFSRSLYRSPPVMLGTIVSQLISWLIVLPNSVVWTWSLSLSEKIQAYMSSLRVWVLLLITCNLLWDLAVRLNERLAYQITKRTFLTTIEVVITGATNALLFHDTIASMCERKWALEHQRVNDNRAFQGSLIAHANTYISSLDYVKATSRNVMWILYGPLVCIICSSLGMITVYLAFKALYFHFVMKRVRSQNKNKIASSASLRTPSLTPVNKPELAIDNQYYRLPLEQFLNNPIRARSLVRNALLMETQKHGERFIRPSCYLDFGIIPRNGCLEARTCFFNVFTPRLGVRGYVATVDATDEQEEASSEHSALKRKRKKTKPSTGPTTSHLLASLKNQ